MFCHQIKVVTKYFNHVVFCKANTVKRKLQKHTNNYISVWNNTKTRALTSLQDKLGSQCGHVCDYVCSYHLSLVHTAPRGWHIHTHKDTQRYTLWEHRWPHILLCCQTDGLDWIHSSMDTHIYNTQACCDLLRHIKTSLLTAVCQGFSIQTHSNFCTHCFVHTVAVVQCLFPWACPNKHTDHGCYPITVPSVCLCESEMWSLITRTASILMRAILFHQFPALLLNSLKFDFMFMNTNRIKGQCCEATLQVLITNSSVFMQLFRQI